MRIISGKARGRKILSPESMETRPTLDRIKESIFNIIQNKTPDAVACDIFSGTGSLGLETASRWAKRVYLVDKSPRAYKNLQANVENLKFQDVCTTLNMDAYDALREFKRRGEVFDLIFIDPPYAKEMIPPAMEIIHELDLLKEDGIIVTKIDSSEEIYEGYENIKLYDKRKYGNTTVIFYRIEN